MTDAQLLAAAHSSLREALVSLDLPTIRQGDIIVARDKTQLALSHLQGLENRFRLRLLTHDTTSTTPPTVTAD